MQGVLVAYRPRSEGSTSTIDYQSGTVHRWSDVPDDINIPMSVPGWAFRPFTPPNLEEGDVPMNVRIVTA